ncbi:structural maintenance of chromosomes protein 1A [Camponotus floridanus]|uniref:structural maintenance of chromosomes protein 1A n=1 Tax=Camponotus floridanus TaxID=104421 RepID=UPI000DC6B2A8|nr:structural maintenance of chromosomes protein 1A [Camponotus floridanus]
MSISLKAITLFNFKSFRGKVVIDHFHPFTAIIGPNGSGKSNIMDAISFVLGETLSILRVKHLNELVHGAFIGEPAAEGAYVTIILMKDQIEKSYTRTIQGKDNQYKIDNKIVTRDIYMSELKVFGLDIKAGNFLMPQGCIQYFATTNMSKELTIMFEEISGSNVYKAEYNRLRLELLKENQDVQFAYQIKKTQLRQKKSAMIEKTEAEKYLQLQKQYMKEKFKFQLIQLIFIKKVVKSLETEQKEIKLHMAENLQNKQIKINLLNRTKLEVKSLFELLNKTEESILKLENDIQREKIKHVDIESNTLYWQKKLENARASLDSVNNAHNIHKNTVEELKNELEIITKKLTELSSEDDIVELHNSQVNDYMILKTEAESQAKDFINNINNLMHDQQVDQYDLDNQNRSKMELESKIKIETLGKEQLETQVQKLQTLNDLFKLRLVEKKEEKQKIEKEIRETEEKSLKLISDIAKISYESAEVLQQEKKANIIKNLKECFPGVHDRLFNLCKPTDSRYNVAITKVFGKNMNAIVVDTKYTAKQCIYFLKRHKIGVETFLPLDSIKTEPINDRLRTKLEQTNCKLLYDVLEPSLQIQKAVLYAARNTIVCETAEDARKKAFQSDGNYDCVSLDGCYFQRNGFISGGLTDLIAKAKQWENSFVLNKRKGQLKQELKNLPQISCLQSNFDTINKNINRLTAKNKVIEKDLKDIIEEIKIHKVNLNDLQKELSSQDVYKILRWKRAIEEANVEYKKAYNKEQDIKTNVEQIEIRLLKIKDDYKTKIEILENIKTELDDHRSQIGIVSKLYLENQKAYMLIRTKIKQQKQKCEDILRECKLEGIIIPTLSEISYDVSSSNSNISTESNVWEVMMNIDFSQISNHIYSNTTDLQNIIEQSKIKLTEIQNEYKALRKPDLKADTKVDLIIQQIKETNEKHQELRTKFNNTNKQFEIVKAKRHKLFSNCLEHITEDIDSIYKNLTNDKSAQALIILENPEEPYMSGINYSCIPPSKRCQPLQYLSDGEKTIANLAFRFAMLRYKPTFFIMDEADAALDKSNIKKLVNYMRSQMKNMQAIAITLNTNLSFHANILIGVTTQPKTACTESMIFTVSL